MFRKILRTEIYDRSSFRAGENWQAMSAADDRPCDIKCAHAIDKQRTNIKFSKIGRPAPQKSRLFLRQICNYGRQVDRFHPKNGELTTACIAAFPATDTLRTVYHYLSTKRIDFGNKLIIIIQIFRSFFHRALSRYSRKSILSRWQQKIYLS